VTSPAGPAATDTVRVDLDVRAAASRPVPDVARSLATSVDDGLDPAEAAARQALWGPNAVSSHRARFLPVLWHQVRSPLLVLLVLAAAASFAVGERGSALIICVIVGLSVGLGLTNEYRAERAAESLHSQITHQALVVRAGRALRVDVTTLVPGDLVELRLGAVVPADVRLTAATGLQCDESLLTGESLPSEKTTTTVPAGSPLGALEGCALMGTVIRAGTGRGIVVTTGARTQLGAIAVGLSTHPLETDFQGGLREFSVLLVRVAAVLTTGVFALNVAFHRPLLEALLFSLAIAVGITPQLLPAVVSTSLAAGSHRLRARSVLVKRLVCIEDLGNVDVLFTDKTGTLTSGRIAWMRSVPAGPATSDEVLRWALLCTEGSSANPLDEALWESVPAQHERGEIAEFTRLASLPFDHDRRMASVLVQRGDEPGVLVTKGAPEAVLERCVDVQESLRIALAAEFEAGNRVVAVATRAMACATSLEPGDERDLQVLGLLVFLDPPKADAASALARLADLGITVKVVTGDNPAVAAKVCGELGLPPGATLTGSDLDALDDDQLAAALVGTSVFARVTPEHKARIVTAQRRQAGAVAFLGDGVNDALALHAADVGITVDTATDVAKDAADVILLRKDLGVLADGVVEGRRIFANTIKYVLMGTSSNFGNMFSAAAASVFLGFLPMLPSQILLNNLLYDASQLAIPTDNVDEEQLRRPAHWDLAFIRRFMLFFGPLSSAFDLLTFVVLLQVFHADHVEFRTGWFVESLATQSLVIFAIRTRRTPFFRSQPSLPLTLCALTAALVASVLPLTPLAGALGFRALPVGFFAALLAMVVGYLALIEAGKRVFYGRLPAPAQPQQAVPPHRRLRRRAQLFSSSRPVRPRSAGQVPLPEVGTESGNVAVPSPSPSIAARPDGSPMAYDVIDSEP
jgi:Mg2+-importing ATPase